MARRAFVAGWPVAHSRSPLIHGHWLKTLGLDGSYERVAVTPQDFPAFIARLKSGESGFVGGNVTVPHKEQAFALADLTDRLAAEMEAANTLWVEDGLVWAGNTDGLGFVASLDAGAPGWDAARTAVVLGAGGAARAVVQALRDRGLASIHVLNRTEERAERLADHFGAAVDPHGFSALAELVPTADLLVNTTTLGMGGAEEMPHIDFSRCKPTALVTDIVYTPLVTPFLSAAREEGLRTVDGLGMLLHQAVPGFERWFGRRPVVDAALRRHVLGQDEPAR
jgi:shikimate dehydrogenase